MCSPRLDIKELNTIDIKITFKCQMDTLVPFYACSNKSKGKPFSHRRDRSVPDNMIWNLL